MKAVIRDVWRVSILQAGPQAFPRSWGLLAAVTLVYLLSDLLVALAQGYALPASLRQTVMDTGLQALLLAAFLSAKLLLPRLNQALSAWLGAGVLLNLASLPLALGYRLLPVKSADAWLAVPLLLWLAWSIMVLTHILRQALDAGPITAFVAAAVCVLVSQWTLASLFPL